MAYVFKEITGIKPQFFNHFDTNRESLGYDKKFAKPLLLTLVIQFGLLFRITENWYHNLWTVPHSDHMYDIATLKQSCASVCDNVTTDDTCWMWWEREQHKINQQSSKHASEYYKNILPGFKWPLSGFSNFLEQQSSSSATQHIH